MRFRKFLQYLLPGVLSISLSACMVGEAEGSSYGLLSWPDNGLATLIPDPLSQRGQIFNDDALKFTVYLEDYSKELFQTYINQCQENGFDIDEWTTTDRYSALNDEGYELVLSLDEDQEIMRIDINLPIEDEDASDSEEEHIHKTIEVETSALKTLRELMNEYEDFFVDYCNFMRTYRSYGLSEFYKKNIFEYGEYQSQCKEKLQELKEISEKELDEDEQFIYDDAMSRIEVILNLAKE